MRNKKCSMKELAFEYSVSDRTIRRDILFLSRYAPICTKTGTGGEILSINMQCRRGST